MSGGWRVGKSLFSGMEAVTWLPYAQLIWLIAEDYDMSRQEFTYLAEAGVSSGLVRPSDVHFSLNKYQPCALKSITGCVAETRTLADYRKLAAKPPDLVIVCEPGLIDNLGDVMELLWGRVAEKRGRILLAGTSDQASEEWYKLWMEWQAENPDGGESYSIPTWENLHRFPKGIEEYTFLSYRQKYGEEPFLAHFGGIPAAPRDIVLKGYWDRGLHIDPNIEFDKERPVEITIDPNYSLGHRYTVEALQWDELSGDIIAVDEVAVEGCTHDEVVALCKDRPWWNNVVGGTIDPFAGESHVFGAPPPIGYWRPVQLRTAHRPRVATTVQAIKEALIGPRLRVSPRCERLIWEAPRWKQERTGQPSKENCDAWKAIGYWLVDRFHVERNEPRDYDDNVVIGSSGALNWQFDP